VLNRVKVLRTFSKGLIFAEVTRFPNPSPAAVPEQMKALLQENRQQAGKWALGRCRGL